MNTHSFKSIRLLWLGIMLTLAACKEEIIDESPQILSMIIDGVPQENITIDQQQRLITVLLPATLPSLELATNFTLSKQAYLPPYWTERNAISLTNYCPCSTNLNSRSPTDLAIRTTISNKKQTTTYTINLKSTSPLRIKPLSTPIVYESITNNKPLYLPLHVPVENYYGSSFVQYIAVTPTGSASPNWIGPGGGCIENCAGRLNELALSLTGYLVGGLDGSPIFSSLKPGLHDLDLWLADGTKVHAEGYILVK